MGRDNGVECGQGSRRMDHRPGPGQFGCFGMPGEAIKFGYTNLVLPLVEIAPKLMEMIPLGVKK